MFWIFCPKCGYAYLEKAKFEDLARRIKLGEHLRIALVCPDCRTSYILDFHIGEWVEAEARR